MAKLTRRKFAMKFKKRQLHDKIGGIIASKTKGGVVALTGPDGVDHIKEYGCILHNREGYNEFFIAEQDKNVLQILYRQKKEMESEIQKVHGKLFIKGMDVFKVLDSLHSETRIRFIDLDFCYTYKEMEGLEFKIIDHIMNNDSIQSPFWLAITFCRRNGDYIGTNKFISFIKELFVIAGYTPGEQYEFPYKDFYSPPMLTWLSEWRKYKS